MREVSRLYSIFKEEKISGWGRRNFVNSKIINFSNEKEIIKMLKKSRNKSFITRGLGRSYGDAAQSNQSYVLNVNFLDGIVLSGNKVTVGGGVSINKLLEKILPLGYFLPVTPGSSKVTIGGAIAADVHGKNHHKNGSIGNHITRILIIDGNGETKELKPNLEIDKVNSNYFWATVGGMGLTGVILEATISLIKIETSLMKVDTFICEDLDSLMDLMISKDNEYSYTVAWVDALHKNFRGVLSCGEHAIAKDLKENYNNLLSFDLKNLGNAPNFLPNGILNKITVKTFNQFWFRKSSLKRSNIQTITSFFYPLDSIDNWNRIYGKDGFYQYQFVVPDNKKFFISKTLNKLRESRSYGFLSVLKRFGNSNDSFLSFPSSGWTLAIDLPGSNRNLLKVLTELDEELASLGGKIYLAKDLRQESKIFKKTYINYQKWRLIKSEMDPYNIFQSDLSRRLKM